MTKFLFDPAPTPCLPIVGQPESFPVHRLFCVGRNYAAHAAEMGHDVDREAPFYFTKSAHHLALAQGNVPIAPRTRDYHHEIELVVALHSGGTNIGQTAALDHVFGYGVGLDMTRRDLQAQAKEKRRPWDVGKDVEFGALCSPLRPATAGPCPTSGSIELKVNETVVQRGNLADQIWTVAELISDLSTLYTLGAGDLIFTGTPAGVGPVAAGDCLHGSIDGIGSFEITMVDRSLTSA